jgi:ABC-type Na+ transport system ATPase subunit NatA
MIEIRNLVKYFGTKKVVDDISFSVGKGRDSGLSRAQRSRQIDHHAHGDRLYPPSAGTAIIGGSDIIADPIGARKKNWIST